jgi:hypothetical protein
MNDKIFLSELLYSQFLVHYSLFLKISGTCHPVLLWETCYLPPLSSHATMGNVLPLPALSSHATMGNVLPLPALVIPCYYRKRATPPRPCYPMLL